MHASTAAASTPAWCMMAATTPAGEARRGSRQRAARASAVLRSATLSALMPGSHRHSRSNSAAYFHQRHASPAAVLTLKTQSCRRSSVTTSRPSSPAARSPSGSSKQYRPVFVHCLPQSNSPHGLHPSERPERMRKRGRRVARSPSAAAAVPKSRLSARDPADSSKDDVQKLQCTTRAGVGRGHAIAARSAWRAKLSASAQRALAQRKLLRRAPSACASITAGMVTSTESTSEDMNGMMPSARSSTMITATAPTICAWRILVTKGQLPRSTISTTASPTGHSGTSRGSTGRQPSRLLGDAYMSRPAMGAEYEATPKNEGLAIIGCEPNGGSNVTETLRSFLRCPPLGRLPQSGET